MAESGPKIEVEYTVKLDNLKQGSAEAKKEVASIVPEIQKATKAGGDFEKSLSEVKDEAKKLTPEIQKTSKETKELGDSIDKTSKDAKQLAPELKKAADAGKDYSTIIAEATAIGGGFVTAALAIAQAVSSANEQVETMDQALRVSSGTEQNYAQNLSALQLIADNYQKSIFSLADSFNELTRETRGTVNEGERTAKIFDNLVAASDKVGITVDDTTSSLSGFIDKMKQGTVDSTGLSNEMDKRLYEAFSNVAKQMNLTNGELNEVLKTSDEAVATVLPALTDELLRALGDVHQKNAHDLGEGIEYAHSKLTILLDGLFQTSGAKSALAQGAEDAGSFLDALDKINRRHGFGSAVGAALSKGAVEVAGAMIPGVGLSIDPFGYQDSAAQTAGLKNNKAYATGQSIDWNQDPKSSSYKLPSQINQRDIDVAAEGLKIRQEAEEAANKKLIAQQKQLAAERKRALDEISRQEVADSKQRVAEQLAASAASINEKYRKGNGTLGAMGQLSNTGTNLEYDSDKDKFHKEFTNPTAGDGSAMNFDKAIASMDSVIERIKERYVRLQDVTSKLGKQLQDGIKSSLEGAVSATLEGVGAIGAGLATGTLTVELVGNTFLGIMASLFENIGKSLASYAATLVVAKFALSSLNAVEAAVGAALAFAAAGVARSQMQSSSSQASSRFYTGGIPYGVDNIPVMVSHDEMILNSGQQASLFRMIDGANGGNLRSPNFKQQNSSSGEFRGRLTAELRASTLAFAADIGSIDNDYFRG